MTANKTVALYQEANTCDVEQMTRRHAPLVKRIAYHLSGRLPSSVQIDDLIQAGMIGLIEAARNYDKTQGASFETYAGIRIRGAMIDEVRRNGWAPRSVHRKSREANSAIQEIEAKLGREATDKEVADNMGVDLREYHAILSEATSQRLLSIDEDDSVYQVEGENNENTDPYLGTQMDRYRIALAEAIKTLPKKEQLVMAMYYEKDMNLKEIGAVLGVSESRVCQIHGQAIIRLQGKLKAWQ